MLPLQFNREARVADRIHRLLDIMARLRDPDRGCAWDLKQTFETIGPYTLEEAYEVVDAIDRADMAGLRDELGDLLLQVVFHARMAEEQGLFSFGDVAGAIGDKLVRRHPHVFGRESNDTGALRGRWETHKAAERAEKTAEAGRGAGVLDDLPVGLPALKRAEKLQKRAARVGFDWPEVDQVLDKISEEISELRHEVENQTDKISEELGDLLFVMVNFARWRNVDAEEALRQANNKFVRRFHSIEAALARAGKTPEDADLDEMEALWLAAKDAERA